MNKEELKIIIHNGQEKYGKRKYAQMVGNNPGRLGYFMKGEIEMLYPSEVNKIVKAEQDEKAKGDSGNR